VNTTLKTLAYCTSALCTAACGYQGAVPHEAQKDWFALPYCEDEKDCFAAIKETCPGGAQILRYGARPEVFKCQ